MNPRDNDWIDAHKELPVGNERVLVTASYVPGKSRKEERFVSLGYVAGMYVHGGGIWIVESYKDGPKVLYWMRLPPPKED